MFRFGFQITTYRYRLLILKDLSVCIIAHESRYTELTLWSVGFRECLKKMKGRIPLSRLSSVPWKKYTIHKDLNSQYNEQEKVGIHQMQLLDST